jgi:flagellar basal-body rod modification protein FlgD
MSLSVDTLNLLNGNTAATGQTANEAGSAERFLKLLVAQMQNQDPLNPTDNAQVTSQMAQINTVTGIDNLNTTVKNLGSQFSQLQALQSVDLVGRDITVQGSRMVLNEAGVGEAGYELALPADRVKVEVLSAAGIVIDTLELGASSSGRHRFEWAPKAGMQTEDARFRISASTGATAVTAIPLMRDRIEAVSTGANGQLSLETRYSGAIGYATVKSFN